MKPYRPSGSESNINCFKSLIYRIKFFFLIYKPFIALFIHKMLSFWKQTSYFFHIVVEDNKACPSLVNQNNLSLTTYWIKRVFLFSYRPVKLQSIEPRFKYCFITNKLHNYKMHQSSPWQLF